jgi:hypothetical protein
MPTSTPHRAAAEPSGRDFPVLPVGSVGKDPGLAAGDVAWPELKRRFEP